MKIETVRATKPTENIPWVPGIVEGANMASAVNGIIDVLKNNHIKRNQVKLILCIVDMVVQETEI